MNGILREILHKFVAIYLEDVCIYSRTMEEHLEHLRFVLQRFKEEGLNLRLKKCFLKRWNILATLCLLVKFPFRQRKLKPL
jgi:hypothetical protein